MNENVYPFLHPGRGEMFIELSILPSAFELR